MKKVFRYFSMLLIICLLMSNTDCQSNQEQTSISGAEQIESMEQVRKNSHGKTVEQQNIEDRTMVTTDPTKILWMHIYALDGKIIFRNPVRCKVTSSGKRLQPVGAVDTNMYNMPDVGYGGYETAELIQPDGTFGSSDPYIYWFDPMGRYHQKGNGYLLTDYPIDLKNPTDEITGLYNVHKAAYEYQKIEEQKLRQKESQNK